MYVPLYYIYKIEYPKGTLLPSLLLMYSPFNMIPNAYENMALGWLFQNTQFISVPPASRLQLQMG